MAKTSKTDAVWTQIDTDSLPDTIGSLYHDYKAAYAAMKAARGEFEVKLADCLNVPVGSRAVFGYNFGKLSIAIVPDDTKPKAASSAVSLSTLMRKG